jgi:hypothetical protein
MWGTQIDVTKRIKDERVQQVLSAISNAALSEIDMAELIVFIRGRKLRRMYVS